MTTQSWEGNPEAKVSFNKREIIDTTVIMKFQTSPFKKYIYNVISDQEEARHECGIDKKL